MDDKKIVIIENNEAFSYHWENESERSLFTEAYRDFTARFEAGKLAPLRLDGDEKEGTAYYAFPSMNGIYRMDIKDGKVIAIALF